MIQPGKKDWSSSLSHTITMPRGLKKGHFFVLMAWLMFTNGGRSTISLKIGLVLSVTLNTYTHPPNT